jgi:hypothetical protein
MSIGSLFVRRMHAIGDREKEKSKEKEKEESSLLPQQITSAVVM